jgi:predicted ArsR family transcriptional regulator
MSDSDREEGGRYTHTVSDEEILAVFERTSDPVVTTSDLAEELPIGRRAVRERLSDLEERGIVARKTVGARSVVWWVREGRDPDRPDTLKSFGKYAGTNIAESVEAVSERLDTDLRRRHDDLSGQ